MPVSIIEERKREGISDLKEKAKWKVLKAREEKRAPIWNKKVPDTEIEHFAKIIEAKYEVELNCYWDLHEWSINHISEFWEEVWLYFGIVSSKPFDQAFVKTGPGFLDNEWFSGAEFNYAENLLRIRDNRIAIMFADEHGNFETVTFAEMFEEVKLYAAAFRKNGLQKGDRVACYMSNLKEAVYAMLAAVSIGAIWGGPQPYYGARASAKIVERMEPKFLIAVDQHSESGDVFNMLKNLPTIVDSTPSLEKVIIVPTKKETLSKDLSNIRNSCFLEDFLNEGRLPDGSVPDIVFEQLPPTHPVSISFSSGTTGLPKGPVHSACTLLSWIVDIGFHWNLKCGDTLFSSYSLTGEPVIGQRGEMVVRSPNPSFPAYLWKDDDKKVLNSNYFSKYPGVWCQNDVCLVNPVTKGIVVIGRSDDTITQYGDRFGSGDIYFAIHDMEEIQDYICVGQTRYDGEMRAVLFIKMKQGYKFDSDMKEKITQRITKELWMDCVPDVILEIQDIPYNLNNKRMENVVRKIVATNQIPEVSNIKNPESLKYFCNIPQLMNYGKI
ncbi:acetoacetyl-CoA synthetase-like [Parasteatoda tepidariorum]|uniref:acetoacetyl-CoA synthetase-like n=1 Tax=Parasteatoda tepidariorum TaxID=114398 RepID=UPI0039BD6FF3